MSVVYLPCHADSWLMLRNASNRHNDASARLQLGYAVDGGGNTWENRICADFRAGWSATLRALPSSAISEVLLQHKVRGNGTDSCFAQGSNVKFVIRRASDALFELTGPGDSGVCTSYPGGTAEQNYPGPTTTTTNQVVYEGSPASGDILSHDITDMFKDYWDDPDFDPEDDPHFVVMLYASDAAGALDETTSNRKIAFHSWDSTAVGAILNDGGNGWQLKVTFSTNHAPSVPSIDLTPTGRVTGASTVVYDFDFTDSDGEQCDECYINVHTSASVDGNGKMNAGTTLWDSGWVSPTSAASGRATKTHGGTTPTRGTTYYWQVNVRDDENAESGWSTPVAFNTNILPTSTSRDPG